MVQVGYITRCRSLRDLHSLGAFGPRCVNPIETSTSWYNLYMYVFYTSPSPFDGFASAPVLSYKKLKWRVLLWKEGVQICTQQWLRQSKPYHQMFSNSKHLVKIPHKILHETISRFSIQDLQWIWNCSLARSLRSILVRSCKIREQFPCEILEYLTCSQNLYMHSSLTRLLKLKILNHLHLWSYIIPRDIVITCMHVILPDPVVSRVHTESYKIPQDVRYDV